MKKNIIVSIILAVVMVFSVCSAALAEEEYKNAIGDVDGDGKCAMQDVVETQRYIAKLKGLTDKQLKAADVDEPYGEVNMIDVVCMQKYIAKLIDLFPVENRKVDTDSENTIISDSDSDNKTTDSDTKTTDSESDDDIIIIIEDPDSDTDTGSDVDSDELGWSNIYKP
ncbi:MAG: dockerin type I repeat-containing protein [Clostridiales bacterium]|nr:dockerin type I repeat-containing protein [Clostridiales bacterium]